MKTSAFAAIFMGLVLVGRASAEPSVEARRLKVHELVRALSDPSNDIRSKSADALRPLLAAEPSLAPNWHEKAFWNKRLVKLKPGMLLKDALAILLPDLSDSERKQACDGADWSGGTGVAMFQLDDYWRATFQLKDFDNQQLNGDAELQSFVREAWIKPSDKFTGLWTTWRVDGRKAHEIQFRDGKNDGTFTAFYDSGSKIYEQHYKQGVADGADSGWFKSGKKMYEGQYKDGKQDGVWQHWFENGQLNTKSSYKSGQQHGLNTTWFENGQKQYTDYYRNGKKEGWCTAWDEKGKLLWDRHYRNDEVVDANK